MMKREKTFLLEPKAANLHRAINYQSKDNIKRFYAYFICIFICHRNTSPIPVIIIKWIYRLYS